MGAAGGYAHVRSRAQGYTLLVFCGLVAYLITAWSHRFTAVDGAVAVGPESLVVIGEAPASFSRVDGGLAMDLVETSPRGVSLAVPGAEGTAHLHVRFSAAAENLVRGPSLWDDGRLFLEWIDPKTGDTLGISPIHSARDDDESGPQEVVAESPAEGAVPVLQMQNLGESGSYVVHEIEITPARERAVWWFGRWVIMFGFMAVLAALAVWVPGTKKPAPWRGWGAAAIWMALAVSYVVPGPWDPARPFGVPFAFAGVPNIEAHEAVIDEQTQELIEQIESSTEPLPPPDSFALQLKLLLPGLRPLMHIGLLFAPTLAIAWLVGARGALVLGVMLSLSVEAAQTMFGFGFGWDDVGDLIFNSLGIAAALWAHRRFARRIHSLLPFPCPEPKVSR